MAKDKKSFIMYCDQRGIFDKLSNDQAGRLIKHIFSYVSDENPKSDFVTELAFESIKTALKRDLKKFEAIKKKRSDAGKASAEKRKQNSTNPTSVESVQQTSTNPTVNDSVTVNVNDTVTVSSKLDEAPQFGEFLEYAIEKKPNVDREAVRLKYEAWKENGWKTGGKTQRAIKNWKSTLLNTLKHLGEQERKPVNSRDLSQMEYGENNF